MTWSALLSNACVASCVPPYVPAVPLEPVDGVAVVEGEVVPVAVVSSAVGFSVSWVVSSMALPYW